MGRPSGDHCELSGCTLKGKCLGASVWSTADSLDVAKCMVAPEGAGSSVALGRGRGCSPPGGSGRPGGEGSAWASGLTRLLPRLPDGEVHGPLARKGLALRPVLGLREEGQELRVTHRGRTGLFDPRCQGEA